jgi:hypothetical protein
VAQLGRGRYTIAWQDVCDPSIVYLQVNDKDKSKELLSRLEGPHIPKLEHCGVFDAEETLYRTQFYTPLTAKNRAAWELFKVLKGYAETAFRQNQPQGFGRQEPLNIQRVNEDFASMVEESDELPQSIRDDVRGLVHWAGSYGDYVIEIAKRNLAVDGETLILLDPVFDHADIKQTHREAVARAERRNIYGR